MALEKNDRKVEIIPKPRKCFGMRHVQCILLFIIIITISGMRNILSVTVIAMTSNNPPNENIPTYPDWASKKNIILSSFFWGYVVFQVIAGEIAKKYGPKYLLGIAMLSNAVFCLTLPFFGAQFGYIGVIICRVLQGLTQGPLQPSCHTLLSRWIPIQERARLGNFVYAGAPLGVVIAMPIAGAISTSSVGWPAAFYLYGGIGVAWSITWLIFGSDSPSTYRFVSIEEKIYIQAATDTSHENKTFRTPWKAIFTCAPFYAIIISHCGQNWGYYTLITETPSYMEKIMDFNLASSSFLSGLPYLVQWILSTTMSPIADLLIVRNILSVGASRKIFNSIGTLIPALTLFALVFVDGNKQVLTMAILIIGVGLNGGTFSGFMINHMDISPIHAGVLMAIGNSIGNVFSVIAPLSVDAFSSISGYNESEKQLWNIVFLTAGSVYMVTGLLYVFMGSGEEQPWSKVEHRKISEARKNERLKKLSFIAQSL